MLEQSLDLQFEKPRHFVFSHAFGNHVAWQAENEMLAKIPKCPVRFGNQLPLLNLSEVLVDDLRDDLNIVAIEDDHAGPYLILNLRERIPVFRLACLLVCLFGLGSKSIWGLCSR